MKGGGNCFSGRIVLYRVAIAQNQRREENYEKWGQPPFLEMVADPIFLISVASEMRHCDKIKDTIKAL